VNGVVWARAAVVLGPNDGYLAHANDKRLVRSTVRRFGDGEVLVRVPPETDLAGRHVLVVVSGRPPQDTAVLMALQLIHLVASHSPTSLSVFMPYLPYQRQDRASTQGEAVSAKAVIAGLSGAGAERVYTIERNHQHSRDSDPVPVTSISATRAYLDLHPPEPADLLALPDTGAASRFRELGLRGIRVLAFSKHKSDQRGTWYDGSFGGAIAAARVVIVDDLCSSGSTLVPLVETLRARFPAASFDIFVAHLLCSPTLLLERLPAGTGLAYTDSCQSEGAIVATLPLGVRKWLGDLPEPID
jgi:ribose-phosphate pyrophosphokinase